MCMGRGGILGEGGNTPLPRSYISSCTVLMNPLLIGRQVAGFGFQKQSGLVLKTNSITAKILKRKLISRRLR
jgi:hypothetical protein